MRRGSGARDRLFARRRGGEGRHHDAGEDGASCGSIPHEYQIHHGGNSLNNVANLHVIMAIRNTEFFEVLLPEARISTG